MKTAFKAQSLYLKNSTRVPVLKSTDTISIFQESIKGWHARQEPAVNPYGENSINFLLFKKNQIDTIQWHKEDEIRRTDLPAMAFVELKRSIDQLNQQRTDLVELIDDHFMEMFALYPVLDGARLNSETPAWMIDRMSILELKIWHMQEQTERTDVSEAHLSQSAAKLQILLSQRTDLAACLDELQAERINGTAMFKVYRQMKMYNDKTLNPSLYEKGAQ